MRRKVSSVSPNDGLKRPANLSFSDLAAIPHAHRLGVSSGIAEETPQFLAVAIAAIAPLAAIPIRVSGPPKAEHWTLLGRRRR